MEGKGLTVNGREAKRVTLGGAVLWEKGGERFVYELNPSEQSYITFDTIKLVEDGPVFSLDLHPRKFIRYSLNLNGWVGPFSLTHALLHRIEYKGKDTGIDLGGYFRNVVGVGVSEGRVRTYIDGVERCSLPYDESVPVRFNWFGLALDGHYYWQGRIYGVSVDGGQMADLATLPGIVFHNVTRYALDVDGNPIESTKTLLND